MPLLPGLKTHADLPFKLMEIAALLTAEENAFVLKEKILEAALSLTGADGGTFYRLSLDQSALEFDVVRNGCLKIGMEKGVEERSSPFPPIPLYREDGSKNLESIAAFSFLKGESCLIDDVYHERHFDFKAAKAFDRANNYQTKSLLTTPLIDLHHRGIGVLQLINKTIDGKIVPFTSFDQKLLKALASLAASALLNRQLILHLKEMLEGFIQAIADIVDEKSPYTGRHSMKVPLIAVLLAEAVNEREEAPFEEVSFTEAELYELQVAALLHDCGKITVPSHLIEKKTRLEGVFDRQEVIDLKLALWQKELEVQHLQQALGKAQQKGGSDEPYPKDVALKIGKQIERCNSPDYMLTKEDKELLSQLRQETVTVNGQQLPILDSLELENLTIPRGTLNAQELKEVQGHALSTIRILSKIPYPEPLKNVLEIAGSHHERLDGKGYPFGKKKEELSWRARILMIADVFEVLTSSDRPYQKKRSSQEALEVLEKMALDGQIDPDLFQVFKEAQVFRAYEKLLESEPLPTFDLSCRKCF
ncbi:MAG: hypothetical protein K0S07_214 [Chlamydiales bacterium]|jgi:HD-GYP domain-containing protein (c-di-GMP phosphodiesterase class II)|nr:hypothetical protein [Chlamydiales bacterium]